MEINREVIFKGYLITKYGNFRGEFPKKHGYSFWKPS